MLAAFGRSWNDSLSDEDRDRLLLPFLPRLVGTRSTAEVQDRRAFMAADWAVRVFTPAWLRLAKLDEHAEALEGLPELDSVEACRAAQPTINAARGAARAAARAAAWGRCEGRCGGRCGRRCDGGCEGRCQDRCVGRYVGRCGGRYGGRYEGRYEGRCEGRCSRRPSRNFKRQPLTSSTA